MTLTLLKFQFYSSWPSHSPQSIVFCSPNKFGQEHHLIIDNKDWVQPYEKASWLHLNTRSFLFIEWSINLDGQSKDAASARAAQVSQGLSGWSLDVHIYIFTV